MTRLVILDRGEEPGEARALPLGDAPVRVKLLGPVPPLPDGQVLRVLPGPTPARRGLVLTRAGGGFRLRRAAEPTPAGEEILGLVVAVERGPASFSLARGLLRRLPLGWLPLALDVLDLLWRLRHPLTPSLFQGGPEACLAGVRAKYDREAEAREYAGLALTDPDPFERDLLLRHVKPGGRVLDIGCGAGREALDFARAGFRVVGIDLAPRMVEAARALALREGLQVEFRVQDATRLDEPPASFDGAFWAASYQHVPGRGLRVETLRRIARALTPDGVLILMVLYRKPLGLLSRTRLVDLLRRAGATLRSGRPFSEPGDALVREISEASDPREACFFHDFAGPGEVRGELEAAGFSPLEEAPRWWVCRKALPP